MIEQLLIAIRKASASMRRSDIARLSYGLDEDSPWLASCDEFSADSIYPVVALLQLAERFFEAADDERCDTPELRALIELVISIDVKLHAAHRETLCREAPSARALIPTKAVA